MSESRVDYYELADIEGVPSFVMSFLLHGRRKVPKDEHWHLVPFYSGKAEMEKVGSLLGARAYLVVADPAGHVL